MRFPKNPILRRYLARGDFRPRLFMRRVGVMTLVVCGGWWGILSTVELTDGLVESLYVLNLLTIFVAASVIAVGTIMFTQREERAQAYEILRLTPIRPLQIVWGYVGANLFIQRWVAAILIWSVGISTLLASVIAFQEFENNRLGYFPPILIPELPPLHIGGLIVLFGLILGIGIVLTVTAGAVSAAVVNRYPVRPAFSTISGLMVVGIIPLIFLSWNRYPDSPMPILLATTLMASPLMVGWGLVRWWQADWSPFSVASNYVFSIILAFVSFGFIFTLFIWAIDYFFLHLAIEPAILGASCSTAFVGLAILAACIARWKQPSGIAPIIVLGWHLVIVLATVYWVGYQEGGMTLWWIALYVIVILFFGFGFGNVEAATARLWPETD